MRNLNKYFLSIMLLGLGTFLSANNNIYEYEIRFKIKNVISLNGIKKLTMKDNDSYHIIFTGKNRMLLFDRVVCRHIDMLSSVLSFSLLLELKWIRTGSDRSDSEQVRACLDGWADRWRDGPTD